MLRINRNIEIDESEFNWSFVRSGGPGGQNVNKVASKAVLRWNVLQTGSLREEVKTRLLSQQKHRITETGDILITSQKYRDQLRNRLDCLEKLRAMILRASTVPKARKKTKPTRAAKERRLQTKKQHTQKKRMRRDIPLD